QASYSGRKWAHLAILSVFCCALARWGKRKKGPTAAVPAASLRKSRRELVFPLDISIVPPVEKATPLAGTGPARGVEYGLNPSGIVPRAARGGPLCRQELAVESAEDLQAKVVGGERQVHGNAVRLADLIDERVLGD